MGEALAGGLTKREVAAAALAMRIVAEEVRLGVLLFLEAGERNVGEVCAHLGMSQPAVSHHLALMRMGGFLASSRRGKNVFYAVTPRGAVVLGAARGVARAGGD